MYSNVCTRLRVPQDRTETARWHRLAADQGGAMAQVCFGAVHHNGTEVPQDNTEDAYRAYFGGGQRYENFFIRAYCVTVWGTGAVYFLFMGGGRASSAVCKLLAWPAHSIYDFLRFSAIPPPLNRRLRFPVGRR